MKSPCPVRGCKHKELTKLADGEFDIVMCPEHGWQYPIPAVPVPLHLMEEFLMYARQQPRAPGVHRELVHTPARWSAMAREFMSRYEGCCGDSDPFECWDRWG